MTQQQQETMIHAGNLRKANTIKHNKMTGTQGIEQSPLVLSVFVNVTSSQAKAVEKKWRRVSYT